MSDIRSARRPRWRGYTAFVLSGGGARGAFQVGALKALLEHGERPDVVVGTSIGSWNGAWLAQSPSRVSIEGLADVWRGLTSTLMLLGLESSRRALPPANIGLRFLMAARRVARGYPSLYSDTGLRQLVERHVGDATFESLRLPLRIIATDLTRGTRAVFSSGPVAPAILASSAMPGVFPPVCLDNHVYLDGGALDNCSLDTALQLGARRIFVVDVEAGSFDDPAPVWCNELTPAALRGNAGGMPAVAAVFERMTQVVASTSSNRRYGGCHGASRCMCSNLRAGLPATCSTSSARTSGWTTPTLPPATTCAPACRCRNRLARHRRLRAPPAACFFRAMVVHCKRHECACCQVAAPAPV